MKLIIGLGNIGAEYEQTRHNVGFLCLDKYAERHQLSFKKTGKYYQAQYKSCLLIKPTTYMNLSGEAYKSVLSKYGSFEEVLIISDDIELPTAEIRIRPGGGDGGHNGLKSLFLAFGSNALPRIRIGIGRPQSGNARDYVLDEFTDPELTDLNITTDLICQWLDVYINRDFAQLLNEYSKWKKKPIPSTEGGIISPKEEPHDKGL